jgi:hypothetical protein
MRIRNCRGVYGPIGWLFFGVCSPKPGCYKRRGGGGERPWLRMHPKRPTTRRGSDQVLFGIADRRVPREQGQNLRVGPRLTVSKFMLDTVLFVATVGRPVILSSSPGCWGKWGQFAEIDKRSASVFCCGESAGTANRERIRSCSSRGGSQSPRSYGARSNDLGDDAHRQQRAHRLTNRYRRGPFGPGGERIRRPGHTVPALTSEHKLSRRRRWRCRAE